MRNRGSSIPYSGFRIPHFDLPDIDCATVNRRQFLVAAAAAPLVLTARRTAASTSRGELIFRPQIVQTGRGPHFDTYVYATDAQWDAFYSDIKASQDGVRMTDAKGRGRFGINVRWNVEGFGYLFGTADNAGDFYELPPAGSSRTLNLNLELARSRVARNERRLAAVQTDGWVPSRDLRAFRTLSQEYLADALKAAPADERCGRLAQKALHYASWAGEWIELERATFDIARRGPRPGFFFGCDARAYTQMDTDLFLERFPELFNYATVTHYHTGTQQDFEPVEGQKQFGIRTLLVRDLRARGITVEGRPLVWFYRTTTPEWMQRKTYAELLKYVERHAREVVRHYGDDIAVWEIANEMHDWANELQLTPDQLLEATKLATEVARDTNPKVERLINNCCLFGDYVQQRKWTELDARYPQRTPYQFMRALSDAAVPFTITGVQMYFSLRDLADTFLLIDRFKEFKRPVHLTEVGATSGPSETSVKLGTVMLPTTPPAWHRAWDDDLQAEWLESMYTLAYSRPEVTSISWYDFVDPHSWIRNGGLLRSPAGELKPAADRLKRLRERWSRPA